MDKSLQIMLLLGHYGNQNMPCPETGSILAIGVQFLDSLSKKGVIKGGPSPLQNIGNVWKKFCDVHLPSKQCLDCNSAHIWKNYYVFGLAEDI